MKWKWWTVSADWWRKNGGVWWWSLQNRSSFFPFSHHLRDFIYCQLEDLLNWKQSAGMGISLIASNSREQETGNNNNNIIIIIIIISCPVFVLCFLVYYFLPFKARRKRERNKNQMMPIRFLLLPRVFYDRASTLSLFFKSLTKKHNVSTIAAILETKDHNQLIVIAISTL